MDCDIVLLNLLCPFSVDRFLNGTGIEGASFFANAFRKFQGSAHLLHNVPQSCHGTGRFFGMCVLTGCC